MQDLKDATRQLAHRPGFAITVILTLALGIGANALVFSVVQGVLLKPLPFPESDRLVTVWETQPGASTRGVAPANFLDWRSASGFEGLAAYDLRRRSLAGDDPQRISVATVSSNFFDVLEVKASAGRTFTGPIPDGTVREILLREDFWRAHFSGDSSIVGRTVRLDDETLVVAGVIPTALGFPEEAVAWTQAPHDIPELGAVRGEIRTMRDAWYFRVVGRMKGGISRAQAQTELDGIAARLRESYPATNRNAGVNVVNLRDQLTGASAPMLWILFGVVTGVLAIACANVATLLLAGAMGRSREFAIRAALGASRQRLVRQLSVESLVLAFCGSGLGLALAWGGRAAMISLLPGATPRTASIGIDVVVVLFTFGLAVMTAAAFGVAPALIASRAGSFTGLRDGGRSGVSRSGSRTGAALIAGQLAIALVLVTGTGLMLRTLWTLHQRDVGIDVARLLAIDITVPDARSRGRAATVLDLQRMSERLAALPGVSGAAAVGTLPLAARGPSANIRVQGRTFPPNEAPDVVWKMVTPGYFHTVGGSIIRGRAFTDADREGSQPVAVINATLAERLWPGGDPLGAHIGTGLDGDGAPLVVVGVVGDTPQEGIGAEVLPEMYRPLAQPARFGAEAMSFVVRTDGDPARLATAARQAIREVHPRVVVAAIRPLSVVAAGGIATERNVARALAIFGALALLLAAVGLYGVMARLVNDRTRELGVRLALGAEPRSVRRLILGRTLRLAGAGLLVGAAASVALSRQLGALLHGVSTADPFVFIASAAVLVVTALAASYFPARRASRIDPLVALRAE